MPSVLHFTTVTLFLNSGAIYFVGGLNKETKHSEEVNHDNLATGIPSACYAT